ncbi:hypothetical protein A2U01_0001007 [Trifolium medium]|uniref:Valyl-tRNA synthetase tRNA-binding arm domain-containing protein n=1 Tax=Trifolium medium TaxID=97028 RepID=A0A392LZ23_9FABA|nr:hypothetical protein [Trifolium medium]
MANRDDISYHLTVKGVQNAIAKLQRKIDHIERLNPQFYRTVNGVQVPTPRSCDAKIAELNAEKQEREAELRQLLENPPKNSGSG